MLPLLLPSSWFVQARVFTHSFYPQLVYLVRGTSFGAVLALQLFPLLSPERERLRTVTSFFYAPDLAPIILHRASCTTQTACAPMISTAVLSAFPYARYG